MSQSGSSIPLIGSSIPASDGPYISISSTLVSSLKLLITICKSNHHPKIINTLIFYSYFLINHYHVTFEIKFKVLLKWKLTFKL
ncbi:hypothetical protein Hanom_Chr09g00830291 [Helianthus anomalus]